MNEYSATSNFFHHLLLFLRLLLLENYDNFVVQRIFIKMTVNSAVSFLPARAASRTASYLLEEKRNFSIDHFNERSLARIEMADQGLFYVV